MPARRALEERFWEKVDKSGDCWVWIGSKNAKGYGMIWVIDTMAKAHRVSYELTVGPIPDGHQLDHLCRTRSCVRPSHLEPVTPAENVRRGEKGELYARPSHCSHGHPLDSKNLRVNPSGSWACRACGRAATARHHQRAKERANE